MHLLSLLGAFILVLIKTCFQNKKNPSSSFKKNKVFLKKCKNRISDIWAVAQGYLQRACC